MLMVITPTHVRFGKDMQGFRVRCVDRRGELEIPTIARNQAGAANIVRAWLEGRDWHPAHKGSIQGWTDTDLGPEAA